ncbi:MAG: endonuclease [Deltaproteobacteria bacterium HGW-Deltaproteobacteria-15]|nr:MAG: endonuclease [Deltaproteobacteria bacterium HGW-Deltaproteobacteria-15]
MQEDNIIRKSIGFAWVFAALIVDVSTVLPLIRSSDWWIRWFDFPRFQILVLGMVLVGLQWVWGGRMSRFRAVMISTLLLSVGYQTYRILPYTQLSGEQVESAARDGSGVVIRFITANVLMHNRQAEKYLQVVAKVNPDIILTTETDQWWADRLKALDPSYPYQVKYPLENTYGMILHSRFPLVNPSVQFLIESMVPSIHTGIRLPGGHVFQLVGLHPRPPGPTHSEDTAERDAELIVTGKFAKRSRLPFIVLGDLNDVAWSHTTSLFQKISGLLDPRIGRGMFNTFHADYFLIRFPLDHIFHSAHFRLIEMRRLEHIGSDHFPFYAALSFKPQKDSSQEPPAPKPREEEEADDILEEAIEKKLSN